MAGKPRHLDHPRAVYIIGFIFAIVTFAVIGAAFYNLTFSHHGPMLLEPIKARIEEKDRSLILEEVTEQEEYEKHRHFHNLVEYPQLPENLRPVCYICHSDYPHSKVKKVRALLNMHTQFFVCETCHIEQEEGDEVVYTWYNPFEQYPKGPFFGTDYDPETGNLAEVEDLYSKIAPFYKRGEKLDSAIQVQDAPLAKDYMKVRDRLTPEQRDNVKKKFHVNIKAKGHECKACHKKRGFLDFKKLGFSPNRVVDLEQLNITGMITKYETFYLPNLFKESE